jgi:adenosine deaminase
MASRRSEASQASLCQRDVVDSECGKGYSSRVSTKQLPGEPVGLFRPWLSEVPKIELHVHLEGAIPLATLWDLVVKYGGDPAVPTLQALAERFRYKTFEQFIDTWVWKNSFLRSYEDFELVAEAVARQWASERIVYVEAFYSPGDFARHGLKTQELTLALRRGLARVPEVRVQLVADLIRDFGPSRALRTLSEVSEVRTEGVIGVGIGGSEQDFPPEPFAFVFATARKQGFHTSAHAGEAAGAGSIRGALESLEVDRVGHATRAAEDPTLVDLLLKAQIPLELCPLSNCATGVIPALSLHPLRRFFDLGMRISVNTDDPAMFGYSLARELDLVAEAFAFTDAELYRLICDAALSAWLSPQESLALQATLENHSSWPTSAHPKSPIQSTHD